MTFFCLRHKKTSEQSGLCSDVERLMGVEPTYAAWEAAVLPMNYSRIGKLEPIIADPISFCNPKMIPGMNPSART